MPGAGSGIGGRPEFGVCAAVDMHYLRTGGARAAVVPAAEAVFAHVLAERTGMVAAVAIGCARTAQEVQVRIDPALVRRWRYCSGPIRSAAP